MDFHKPLFWIRFIIIRKVTFIAYDLNRNYKFKELRLFSNEHSLYDIFDETVEIKVM